MIDRIHRAGKLGENSVARRLDQAPAVFGELGVEQLVAQRLQPGERPRLVGFHEARIADDVGRLDDGEPTLCSGLGHVAGPLAEDRSARIVWATKRRVHQAVSHPRNRS